MDLLIFNFKWMIGNVFLAFIPVAFGMIMLKSKWNLVKLLSGILWFVFLPNTIYLLTDFMHFFEDTQHYPASLMPADLVLYIIIFGIGIFTFVLAVYPFEKLFFRKSKKYHSLNMAMLFGLNLIIGFGMVLGRVQRANSWDIVLNTGRVIQDVIKTILSPELVVLTLVFAVMCQIIYTTFDDVVLRKTD